MAEDEFLNDNIINFYLAWLYGNLSEKYQDIVHIFSSHFYTRLKSKDKRGKKDTKDKDKSRQEQAYEKAGLNVFNLKKNLLFIHYSKLYLEYMALL